MSDCFDFRPIFCSESCLNSGESKTAAANFHELLHYFLCLISSCVVQYELRLRWPLGEEYSKGRSVARSLKTARVHPSLTSMIQFIEKNVNIFIASCVLP
jgi:hypothetical protein